MSYLPTQVNSASCELRVARHTKSTLIWRERDLAARLASWADGSPTEARSELLSRMIGAICFFFSFSFARAPASLDLFAAGLAWVQKTREKTGERERRGGWA